MDQTTIYNSSVSYGDPARPAAAALQPAQALRSRIAVIDVMRGLVMMVMMFDHMRETIFLHMQVSDPIDVTTTDPALFFTRFAAHFCAPMFVFLTGLSAWLYAHPAAGPRDATGFLVKRGALLIVLEIVLVSFAWSGQFPPPVIYLQVIWVIGLAMIVLALMHRLPMWLLAGVGFAIVFGHNALSPIAFAPGETGFVPWTILHDRGFLVAEGALKIKISYPLLPWIGVILLGYVAGPLYAKAFDPARRARLLVRLGLACLAALAVLRGFNIYGETLPWVQGETAVQTVMSFLNYTKYPPSLAFVLMTLGVGMIALAYFEKIDNWFTRVCATFGGAPMFYYLLHLYVLLLLQNLLVLVFGANHGARFGVDQLWIVWVGAIAMLPVLYLPCRAFANFKRTSNQAWVRYF